MSKPYRLTCALFIFILQLAPFQILASEADSTIKDDHSSHFDYFLNSEKRGERLFKGLTRTPVEWQSCVSCHNINYIDTLNWNPSAKDIAGTFANKSIDEFRSVLMSPLGKKWKSLIKTIPFLMRSWDILNPIYRS